MKSEDFERLKAVCEKEGFDIGFKYDESTYTVRLKKDQWDGVEFVELDGKIEKVQLIDSKIIYTRDAATGKGYKHIQPSTESAYIEQLKAEAFKRFGEIKEGDRFIIECRASLTSYDGFGFKYFKDQDLLCFNGYHIYHQGKWATRVPERIKVKNWSYRTEEKDGKIYHECVFICPIKEFDDDVHIFLVSQLEEYLNK